MTMTEPRPTTEALIRNPSLHVIRCNADEIVVRSGTRSKTSQTLADDERRGLLADVVEQLSLSATPAELLERLPGADAADVDQLLAQLVEHRVVTTLDAAESGLVHYGLQRSEERAIAARRVAVVGSGAIATAVRANLADLGVTDVVDAAEGPDLGDGVLADLFDDADLVVVATDEPDLSLLYRCNGAAIETGTPWLSTHADGPELVIGPLFRPGETACFNDYDIQEEAGRTFRMDHLFYKSALASNGFERRTLPRASAEHAAAMASHGIVQELSGSGSFLEGTVVRVDMERLEVIRELVMRLPRCPACSQLAPDYRHPFL